jgi:hypothetical protein
VIFGEVCDRAVDDLAIAGGLADTHVHDDLHEARNLVHVGVAVLLGEGLRDLGPVLGLESRLDFASLRSRVGHYRSLPDFLRSDADVFVTPSFVTVSFAEADAGRLLRLGVDERDVRDVDRGLVGLDAAGLRAALRLADAARAS